MAQRPSVVATLLGLVVSLAAGCGGATSTEGLNVEASFASGVPRSARDEAVRVEGYLLDSCDSLEIPERPSDAIGSTLMLRAGTQGPPIAAPDPGEYGLYAVALDSNCAVVAAGCDTVTIVADSQAILTVTMGAFSGGGCAAGEQCSIDTGDCIGPDGGTGGVGGVGGTGGVGGVGGAGGIGGVGGTGGVGGNVIGSPCTVQTQDEDCNGKTCNPITLECTDFGKWERGTCETCVSDENCWNSGDRCVPMFFEGDRYPDDHTGFCLPAAQLEFPGGPYECNGEEPYVTVIPDRASMSGAGATVYCGPREDFTTCDAVSAQLDEIQCTQGADDECPAGGLCRYTQDNGKWDYRCTYACTSNSECANLQGWELDCAGFCGA